MAKRRKHPRGQTIGGVLFGFEQQVLRTMPPAQELVHHARPDDPLPAGDGGFVTIELRPRSPFDRPARSPPSMPELTPTDDRTRIRRLAVRPGRLPAALC